MNLCADTEARTRQITSLLLRECSYSFPLYSEAMARFWKKAESSGLFHNYSYYKLMNFLREMLHEDELDF